MPTYVSLIHFTQKGIESIKEDPRGSTGPNRRSARRAVS